METNDDNPDESDLVDLLYADELDEETAGRLRARLRESSPGEAADLEEYERLLARIREEETEREVPDEVHDSIVSTARRAAGDRGKPRGARPDRREPSAPDGEASTSLWAQIASGANLTSMATAAAALLACGVVLYIVRGDVVSPDQEAEPTGTREAAADQPGGESEDKVLEPTDEKAKSPSESEPPSEAPEEGADDPSSEPELIRGDESEAAAPVGEAETTADEADEPSPDRRRQRPSAPSTTGDDREPQARKRAGDDELADAPSGRDDSEQALQLFDGNGPAGSSGSDDDDRQREAAAGSASPSRSNESDSKAGEDARRHGGGGGRTRDSEDDDTDDADDAATLAAVEEALRRNALGETIRLADRLAARDDVDATAHARALELKALAHKRRGAPETAREIYSQLADEYPNYKRSHIQQELQRLAPSDDASSDGNSSDDSMLLQGDDKSY